LITPSSIEQQQLLVDQSRSVLNVARRDAQQMIAEGKLAIEGAEKEILANQLAVTAAKSASGIQTMEKQIELLRLQLKTTKLISPIDGTVLSIDTKAGEPTTTTTPIMRLADTRRMIARAEINVVDLQRIAIGANATITSSAIRVPLRGKVKSVSQLVGSPRLASPNPMARVDWRSAQVIIEIDSESVGPAAERIHLQVDIAIEAEPMSNSSI
jgi:HlyD family secretion protein